VFPFRASVRTRLRKPRHRDHEHLSWSWATLQRLDESGPVSPYRFSDPSTPLLIGLEVFLCRLRLGRLNPPNLSALELTLSFRV